MWFPYSHQGVKMNIKNNTGESVVYFGFIAESSFTVIVDKKPTVSLVGREYCTIDYPDDVTLFKSGIVYTPVDSKS